MELYKLITDSLTKYDNVDISNDCLPYFKDRISVPIRVIKLAQVMVDSGNEITPNKDNYLIGLYALNYLTVCRYLKVVEVGQIRKYFKYPGYELSDLNPMKLAIDVTESVIYGLMMYEDKVTYNNQDKTPIIEKFKDLYKSNVPRSFKGVLDVLSIYFKASNTIPKMAIFNDVYPYNKLNTSPKYRDDMNTKMSDFRRNCVNSDETLKMTESTYNMLNNCVRYRFKMDRDRDDTELNSIINSVDFYNGYFSDVNKLNEFVAENEDYLNGKSDKDYYLGRTFLSNDNLESFKINNERLFNYYNL